MTLCIINSRPSSAINYIFKLGQRLQHAKLEYIYQSKKNKWLNQLSLDINTGKHSLIPLSISSDILLILPIHLHFPTTTNNNNNGLSEGSIVVV